MSATLVAPPTDAVQPSPAHRRADGSSWWAAVLLVLALVLVATDVHVPLVRPAAGLFALVVLPALVLVRRVDWRFDDTALATVYAAGLTLLGVVLLGLGLNTVLPAVGVDRPLDRPVLVVASGVLDLALLCWRPRRALAGPGALCAALGALVRARLDPAVTLGVLSVVAAVLGAIRLNNGLSGSVAVTAHALAVAAVALVIFLRRRGRARDLATIYLAATSLLLGTSLRGWEITGHDIQREYLAFLLTHNADHWQMSAYPSPYNACLSVNILPSMLCEMTGLGGVYVFKLLLQLVFAVVPVLVYVFARRHLSGRTATLAAAFFVFFPTFFTDMSYLVRQEIAFVFVALVLLAATQRGWSVRVRRGAVVAFGAGVVVSHYSTTYMLIITVAVGLLGVAASPAVDRLRRRARPATTARSPLVLLSPVVVVALGVMTWLWTTPATHSGGHLVDTVRETATSLLDGGDQTGSSDLNYSLFSGASKTPTQRFGEYVDGVLADRKSGNSNDLVVADPTPAETRPPVVDRDYLPLTAAGETIQDAGLDVRGLNSLVRQGTAALFQVFLLLGVIALLWRRTLRHRFGREQTWLVVGALGALGAVVVIPSLSAEYGVLRAFQQSLLVTAPVLAIGAETAFAWLRRRRATAAAGIVVVGMGLSLTGVQPALLGGYFGQLSQSNSGLYYDLYYVAPSEVSAAQWLGRESKGSNVQSEVVSDKVAVTRLQSYVPAGVSVNDEFFPLELRKGTYVFLGAETVDRQRATIFYTGDLITYRYPVGVLRRNLDLVYSNPKAQVYR